LLLTFGNSLAEEDKRRAGFALLLFESGLIKRYIQQRAHKNELPQIFQTIYY